MSESFSPKIVRGVARFGANNVLTKFAGLATILALTCFLTLRDCGVLVLVESFLGLAYSTLNPGLTGLIAADLAGDLAARREKEAQGLLGGFARFRVLGPTITSAMFAGGAWFYSGSVASGWVVAGVPAVITQAARETEVSNAN